MDQYQNYLAEMIERPPLVSGALVRGQIEQHELPFDHKTAYTSWPKWHASRQLSRFFRFFLGRCIHG